MADLASIQQKIIAFRYQRDRAQFHDPLPRYFFALVIAMLVTSMWLTSCAIPISYRDAITYKNLTDLKAEAMTLVETFDTRPVAQNEAAIEGVTLEFQGRGSPSYCTFKSLPRHRLYHGGSLLERRADYRRRGTTGKGTGGVRQEAVD